MISSTPTDVSGLDAFLDLVLSEGLEAVGSAEGSLMLLNRQERMLEIVQRRGPPHELRRRHRRFPVGEGVAGWVAVNCKPYFTPDVTQEPLFKPPLGNLNFRSLLVVPIMQGSEAIGVICADSPEANRFHATHVEALSRLAERVAPVIQQLEVDIFISYTKRVGELEAISEIGRDLAERTFESPEDLDAILHKIVTDAERVLGADLVTLYQYYEAEDRFVTAPTRAGRFHHPEWMISSIHQTDAPGRIVRAGKSNYCDDAASDLIMRATAVVPAADGLPERPCFVDREHVSSSAGILLRAGTEVGGVMFINYRAPHRFTSNEIRVIETFGAFAALAIHGARRVMEKIRLSREKLVRSFVHRVRNLLPITSYWLARLAASGGIPTECGDWCRVALDQNRRAQSIVTDFEVFSKAEASIHFYPPSLEDIRRYPQ